MGLALLANLSAYDFGYLSAGQLIARTAHTFDSMATLERFRGHFYNWYDTQTLQPLLPMYISSVDSGNLAGHVMTLRAGLLSLPDHKIVAERAFEGLRDTLALLFDALETTRHPSGESLQTNIAADLLNRPTSLAHAHHTLRLLTTQMEEVTALLDPVTDMDAHRWADAVARQCHDTLAELALLAPWIGLPITTHILNAFPELDQIPTLRALTRLDGEWLPAIEQRLGPDASETERVWLIELQRHISSAGRLAEQRLASLDRLTWQSNHFSRMEYDFLFDDTRYLLSIGYNVAERRCDASYYDLLASEARLCSFVAIAQGQIPQESWFALGRLLTTTGGEPILLSWSGSMFEYLMPLLVMPTYQQTLLDQTYHAAVARQIEYGRERGIPWGISESGYNMVDVQLNYQYRAFGVPGLGLKRGLGEELVIAPYATSIALMVAPEAACLNLQRLTAEGADGPFGLYEAIDYTPSRLPRGQITCHHSLVYGSPCGDEFSLLCVSAPRPPDAETLRSGSAVSGHHAAAPRTYSKSDRLLFAQHGAVGLAYDLLRSRHTRARLEDPEHSGAGSATLVERSLPRHGHERGGRLQSLEGSRRDALA